MQKCRDHWLLATTHIIVCARCPQNVGLRVRPRPWYQVPPTPPTTPSTPRPPPSFHSPLLATLGSASGTRHEGGGCHWQLLDFPFPTSPPPPLASGARSYESAPALDVRCPILRVRRPWRPVPPWRPVSPWRPVPPWRPRCTNTRQAPATPAEEQEIGTSSPSKPFLDRETVVGLRGLEYKLVGYFKDRYRNQHDTSEIVRVQLERNGR